MTEYRVNFLIGLFSFIFVQGAALAFLFLVFNRVQIINGWTLPELLFIYAIACLGRFIHQTFFDQLWSLGYHYIRNGNFDRILVRPVNPLFHLIADKAFNHDGIGQLIIGSAALYYSSSELAIDWSISMIMLLIVMIVSSGLIFSALNLLFASLSFFIIDSLLLMNSLFVFSDYSRYPMGIFPSALSVMMTWLVPYAFTGFYPADYLLHQTGIGWMTPFVAIFLCVISYSFWMYGLNRYKSTGS